MPPWVDKLLNSQFVQLGLAALAFLIALWLVVVIARMLMGGRLRLPGGRTRQARLGIVDAFDLDRQRQLIIVRRDNTEHLIMIGGPNDLVIESEIVRVEARDVRDGRREKGFDGFNDGRVPAPFAAPAIGLPSQGGPSRQEEPLLPMALPQTAPQLEIPTPLNDIAISSPSVEPAAPRAPTFPLPSRRPATPTAQPDRRTPSATPERIAPTIEALNSTGPANSSGQPSRPAMPPAPAPRVSEAPASQPDIPASGPAPGRPAPFLKPLPPRAPLRPLKRVTPQAEPVTPSQQPPVPQGSHSPAVEPTTPRAGQPPPPAAPPTVGPEPSQPNLSTTEGDGLASLEEEMAKLLGR